MVVGGCGSIHPRKRDAGIGAAMAPVPALSLPLSTVEAPIKSTNKRRVAIGNCTRALTVVCNLRRSYGYSKFAPL